MLKADTGYGEGAPPEFRLRDSCPALSAILLVTDPRLKHPGDIRLRADAARKALRYQGTPQVTKVREENVIFQVASEIEADGMTVLPGTYPGTKKKLGVPFMGKAAWQDPEYRLILPTPGTQFLYAEVDVTPHVLAGTVSVE